MAMQAGQVRTQAATTSPAIPQRTAESRRVEPTPMIAEPMTWVVLNGKPNREAPSMIIAAEVSAAKPCIGSSLVIRTPSVLMMRHPPNRVEIPIVVPESRMTQRGTANSVR